MNLHVAIINPQLEIAEEIMKVIQTGSTNSLLLHFAKLYLGEVLVKSGWNY